ncbi:MAG: c-type cytochrome [Rhizobiaceae bacterium]
MRQSERQGLMVNRLQRITGIAKISGVQLALALLLPVFAQAQELFPDDAYANYKADVANGQSIFNAGGCGSCHGAADNPELLSGGLKLDSFVGTFYAPNLTHSAKGVGNWSNANFLNAMINGVSPDGYHYYPVFPYTNYAGMKPEDVLDIKGYIQTLEKSDNVAPEHDVSFPYNLNATMSLWKRKNFSPQRWAPGKDDQLSRGQYLVENVGACGACHTPRSTTYGLIEEEAFKGTIGLTGSVAPAIDASVMNGLASPEIFTKGVLVDGKKLNGQPLADPVMRRVTKLTAKLSESDRLAMFAYLKGSEVVKKKPDLVSQTCSGSISAASQGAAGSNDSLSSDADEFIGRYCRNCHGPGQSSQGSFPAGSLSSIAADASFVTPGNPAASRLYSSITSGRMPLGNQPSPEEIARLEEWITSLGSASQSGPVAAELPPMRSRKVYERAELIRAALDDVGSLDELDRPYIRYFSYRSHYNGRFPCETDAQFAKRLELYGAAFNKMLNSVSSGPRLVVPDTVSDTKELLVRVDIRDLGWDQYQWDVLVEAYPYGVDPHSDATLSALTKETHSVLPIMRTDWFSANSSRPAIYHALLNLPEHIRDLEARLGVDVDRNIDRGDVARAGFDRGASGVSAHNRMVERHDLPQGGYYWKSYDFAGSFGTQSLRDFPHGPPENAPLAFNLKPFTHDGGEMIFSLPNGLQGYYLSDHLGNRIDEGPEKIVSYQQRPKDKAPTIINGRSCIDCHANGILTKLDSMRKHIQTTNKFDIDQAKFLLSMYIEQAEMDQYYDDDMQRFVRSLKRIGATEKGVDGRDRSRNAPGKKEIVTWYADMYEDNLNLDAFAAEFDLEGDDFKASILRIQDPLVQQLAMQKILQLEGGATVPRFEVEQQFPYLQKALMGLDPLTSQQVSEYAKQYTPAVANTESKKPPVKQVHAEKAYETGPVVAKADPVDAYKQVIPQYQQKTYIDGDKLKLALKVDSTKVRVGEKLAFTIESNHDCEVQILYVESNGKVEVFPSQLIGDPWLKANQPKRIPVAEAGHIEFDEPAHSESLILFCDRKGLAASGLSADEARKIAAKSKKPATRGISFKLAKKVKKAQGSSAFHTVTFNVRPH